jgi:hypothetical protein
VLQKRKWSSRTWTNAKRKIWWLITGGNSVGRWNS